MRVYAPRGYEQFRCLMGDCRHSCCWGWEIDIDASSLEKYLSLPGQLGDRLRENIDTAGETPCFHLDEEEKCPFLRHDGLCDLILSGGEGMLCQICADHPRFRNFYAERIEIGLGLCCEGAGKLLLSQQEKASIFLLEDGEENLKEEEEEFLLWREKLIEILQDRSIPISDRILAMLNGEKPDDLSDYLPLLLQLEYMEDAWPHLLRLLQERPERWKGKDLPSWLEIPMEQLLFYLFYRHLSPALDDGLYEERLRFCLLMYQLICALCALQGEMDLSGLVEFARLYSAEMEYSDENIGAVLSALQ